MTNFVIAFDRTRGQSISVREFKDPAEAIRFRLRTESEHSGRDVEVVLLRAPDRVALQQSHSRYFDPLSGIPALRAALA